MAKSRFVRIFLFSNIADSALDAGFDVVACEREYTSNHCDAPIPGVIKLCADLTRCLNRDTTEVGRATVYVEVLAGVINSFIEPFSTWTVIVIATMVLLAVVLPNLAFSSVRSKFAPNSHREQHQQHQQPYYAMYPPQQPYYSPPLTPTYQQQPMLMMRYPSDGRL